MAFRVSEITWPFPTPLPLCVFPYNLPQEDHTPLHLAAKAGHLDSVKMLLRKNTSCMNYQDKVEYYCVCVHLCNTLRSENSGELT